MADTVLIVEDDQRIGALVRTYLERDGWACVWVRSGEEALAELDRHDVALVLLDLGLPGIGGLDVCRRIAATVPVIIVTARDDEADRVAGLELGADDYVTKPFSPRELAARVRAVLRRAARVTAVAEEELTAGDVRLRPAEREVFVDGAEVQLTQREFDLLAYLLVQRDRVVGRDELLEAVWGFLSPGQTRTVDVHVAQLRRRLDRPDLIRTVRGVGYRVVTR